MVTSATRNRLYAVVGLSLIAVGAYALIHPEHTRGASLVLLGIAILEQGSSGTTRFLGRLSDGLAGRASRRTGAVPRHAPLRPLQPRRRFRMLSDCRGASVLGFSD